MRSSAELELILQMFQLATLVALPLAARVVSAHGWVNSWTIDTVTRDGFVPSDPGRFPVSAERPTDNPKHGAFRLVTKS